MGAIPWGGAIPHSARDLAAVATQNGITVTIKQSKVAPIEYLERIIEGPPKRTLVYMFSPGLDADSPLGVIGVGAICQELDIDPKVFGLV